MRIVAYMQWTDQAIVLSTRKFSEHSGIVSTFTLDHGRAKGLVRQVSSRTNRGIYQISNKITATWQARLPEQLGFFKAELIQPVAAICLSEPLKLLGLASTCALLDSTLAEHEAHPHLYHAIIELFNHMLSSQEWLSSYIKFEILLLEELGFQLELEQCGATGQLDELIYVSPKTGRAISQSAGAPYKDKLLHLPAFLTSNGQNQPIKSLDIKNGLELGAYFLNKYVLAPHAMSMPSARTRLYESLIKQSIAITV